MLRRQAEIRFSSFLIGTITETVIRVAGSLTLSGSRSLVLIGCNMHDLFDCIAGLLKIVVGQGWMNQECQAALSQPSCIGKPLGGNKRQGEGFLEVNLAATPYPAGHSFGTKCFQDAIAVPSIGEELRFNKRIVPVVSMLNVGRRHRNSQR